MFSLLLIAAPAVTAPDLNAADKVAIRDYLDPKLLDGASARYLWPAHRPGVVYCGWINAKNRLGAYTGYRQFYVLGAKGKGGKYRPIEGGFENGDPESPDTVVTQQTCASAGYANEPG